MKYHPFFKKTVFLRRILTFPNTNISYVLIIQRYLRDIML